MKNLLLRVYLSFLLFFLLSEHMLAQTSSLTVLSPNGGEYWTSSSYPRITWKSVNISAVKIEISTDAGMTWDTVTPATIAAYGSYSDWQIGTALQSQTCLVKVSKFDDPNVYDVSQSYFSIAADTVIHTLVVLGSSTAAGVGPSTPDSAWVNRYRNFLFEKNTTVNVVNLAVGGYTTYDIMPTGFVPPENRRTPKVGTNITKAVEHEPEAIIINLPSNDVNLEYSISEQLSNYDAILAVVDSLHIPVWITTTQPRNFSDAQIQMQIIMRDSTFSRFGKYAIDFWTDIADTNGRISSEYNAGDGIHLNDRAHAVLFDRVVAAGVFNSVVTSVPEHRYVAAGFELHQNYPNPFNPSTVISYLLPLTNYVTLKVYDAIGREVATLVNEVKSAGNYSVTFNAEELSSGVYFYRLKAGNFSSTKKFVLLK